MTAGKCYVVHCGDWHTFVGRCVRQVNQVLFEFEAVSKIQETNNGDNWDELALGEDIELRRACDYRHYKTPVILPLAIAAIEWRGQLPQEMEDRR